MEAESGTRQRAESLLLDAARSHRIQVNQDEIQAALEYHQHGEDLAQWALSHLHADNLLTVDELALYTALDQSGQVDRLADLHDLADVQPISEADLRAAVAELKRSTDAIKKQTETLRHQHDALSRLVAKRADGESRRRREDQACLRRSESERMRISSEITEIAHGLEFRISQLKKESSEGPLLSQSLDAVLQSDDKLLASLQKLGWELHLPDPEEAKSTDKLRETCLRLIKITVETIRTRLDTAYLTALATAQRSSSNSPPTEDEIHDLQDEVESLYAEILPVAQMSVEKQHLEPALQSISSRSGQSLRKTASSLAYINQCLDYLLSRIGIIHSHVQLYKSHQHAVDSVAATARAEIADKVPDPLKQTHREAIPPSPMKPQRSRSTKSRRRSSGINEAPALDTLMQSLSLPPDVYDAANTKAQLTSLERILRDRSAKVRDLAHDSQLDFEDATKARLEDAKLAIQLVRDTVLAETSFGDVNLVDPDIERSITVLAQEVDKARAKLDGFEGTKSSWGSIKKDEFIERWAR